MEKSREIPDRFKKLCNLKTITKSHKGCGKMNEIPTLDISDSSSKNGEIPGRECFPLMALCGTI